MKIKINNNKTSSVFFENRFYDIGTEIEAPFSTAIRISKSIDTEWIFEKKEYNPDLFRKEKKFGFTGEIDQVSGWGNVSFNLLKNSLDYDISLAGRVYNLRDRDIINMSYRDLPEEGAMIWHEQPKGTWDNSPFPKNIAIIPFETTVIPASWIGKINKFDALLVPCKQNAEAFKNSGVTVPIDRVIFSIMQSKAMRVLQQLD